MAFAAGAVECATERRTSAAVAAQKCTEIEYAHSPQNYCSLLSDTVAERNLPAVPVAADTEFGVACAVVVVAYSIDTCN